jgi:transposase-like protein
MITRDRPWWYIVHASAAGEGAGFWRSVIAGLANRGARDSLITCCDGLAGFEDAITSAFPQILQRCAVHGTGLPVMPASRRELVAAGLEPREGRRNRGRLVGTRLFGSAAEEGDDHW